MLKFPTHLNSVVAMIDAHHPQQRGERIADHTRLYHVAVQLQRVKPGIELIRPVGDPFVRLMARCADGVVEIHPHQSLQSRT